MRLHTQTTRHAEGLCRFLLPKLRRPNFPRPRRRFPTKPPQWFHKADSIPLCTHESLMTQLVNKKRSSLQLDWGFGRPQGYVPSTPEDSLSICHFPIFIFHCWLPPLTLLDHWHAALSS